MADDQQNNQGGGGSAVISAGGAVKVDKGKSAEQYIADVESKYIVPPLVREKFPNLIKLIYETESMDEEEREYWLQIMPIMSEEQIVKLLDILVNEKEQLAKLDQEYNQEMAGIGKRNAPAIDEAKMKEKMAEIKVAESESEEQERSEEEELLKKLDEI